MYFLWEFPHAKEFRDVVTPLLDNKDDEKLHSSNLVRRIISRLPLGRVVYIIAASFYFPNKIFFRLEAPCSIGHVILTMLLWFNGSWITG